MSTSKRNLINRLNANNSGGGMKKSGISINVGMPVRLRRIINSRSVTNNLSLPEERTTYTIVTSNKLKLRGIPITFTVYTPTSVADGTILYWRNTGTTGANDFTSGENNGSFVVFKNKGEILLTPVLNDASDEGTIIISVQKSKNDVNANVVTSPVVTVQNDTGVFSKPTIEDRITYKITANRTSSFRGQDVVFNVYTPTSVVNGTTLYWYNTGTTGANDFTSGENNGSFIVSSNAGEIVLNTITNIATNKVETIIIDVKQNQSDVNAVVTSSPVTLDYSGFIDDGSIALTTEYSVSPDRTSVVSGGRVIFKVEKPYNVPDDTTLYWSNIGTTPATDFIDGKNNGTITLNSDSAQFQLILKPNISNTQKTIIIVVKYSINSDVLATSSTVTVS